VIVTQTNIRRLSPEVREELFEILWYSIEKSLSKNLEKGRIDIGKRLHTFIKYNKSAMNELGIEVVEFDSKYDRFARRQLFPSVTHK
jgi:hypothetical protein